MEQSRVPLSTGVTLGVRTAGPDDAPALLFLHGFPESHRTWRHVAPALAETHRVIVPDQRGYAGSDRPQEVEAYRPDLLIADIFALADACGVDRFTLVGHDWGGAIAWNVPNGPQGDRLDGLVIVNAPHPYIFQKSLIEDEGQRAASQYIRAFRDPAMEARIAEMGLDGFFAKIFAGAFADPDTPTKLGDEGRQAYLDEWAVPGALTGMLNWYRATGLKVPAMGEAASLPRWMAAPFPVIRTPTLVVWGVKDRALAPLQLDGLEALVENLTIEHVADGGHFLPWEKPEAVIGALRRFLAR